MTRHPGLLSRLALALCCSAMLFTVQAQESLPASQYYGATEYIAGGIGSDEAQLFRLARKNFPLSISFARLMPEDRAAYVSDAQLVIRDQYDQTVLNSPIDGPFCLIRLSPGDYKVFATLEGITLNQNITITNEKASEINFQWPATEPST